ncbi:MAG TPA: branched-chain amino acid ABC transporter permease [Nocardioidaceae bacterium]|nr:branched-chain amino acid ABC transporter permease [Nocardioidaceae bacterium]
MALLLMAVFAAVAMTGTAQASTATGASVVTAEDDTINIRGKLVDTREKPPKPVEGVKISVTDDAGKPVGEATSGADGTFAVPLPGGAAEVVGETYTINIDTETLPEGTALRNPKQVSLQQQIKLSSDVFVTFPIGDLPNPPVGKAVQGLQLAVGGLVFSLLLAMAALGLSMIFGTTGLTNFAHGELITFGAIVAFSVDRIPGDIVVGGTNITMVTAIAAALVVSTLFGWGQDKMLWKPLRNRGTGLIAAMIVSIGFSIFLRNVFQYFAGAANHNYSQWTSPKPWEIGPILITPKDVGVIIFSAIVLTAVILAVQRTRLGKATRAVADNPALASSSGINVDRVISVVWAVGAGLAGLSGVLLGMTQGFDYQVGFKILLLVFAAVVLGGLGTIWGALVGSFIIGIFIEVSTLFVPAELKFVGALVVLILVLLVRPQGLLGRAERVG